MSSAQRLDDRIVPRYYAALLGGFTALFVLRVLGQMVVGLVPIPFLPPFDEWYSGLLAYPVLLPIQFLFIAVMTKVVVDFARGKGPFVAPRPRVGVFVKWLSYAYFASMVLRYVLTMARHPELRWFTGTIPIWFHMVLAAFLYTLGHYHAAHGARRPSP